MLILWCWRIANPPEQGGKEKHKLPSMAHELPLIIIWQLHGLLHGNYMLKKNTFRDYNRVLVLKHPRIAINDPRIIMNNNMCNSWTITWQLYVKDIIQPRIERIKLIKASRIGFGLSGLSLDANPCHPSHPCSTPENLVRSSFCSVGFAIRPYWV